MNSDEKVKSMIKEQSFEDYEYEFGELPEATYKYFKQLCYENIMPFDPSRNIKAFIRLFETNSSHKESYLEWYFDTEWEEYLEEKKEMEYEANEYLGEKYK